MRWRLKFRIQMSGRTQRAVARECGMSESRLSEIVHGWRNPPRGDRSSLAKVLQTPEQELFCDSDGSPLDNPDSSFEGRGRRGVRTH